MESQQLKTKRIEDFVDLEEHCPIDVSSLKYNYYSFKNHLICISFAKDSTRFKHHMFKAKVCLELMINELTQVLHDADILQNKADYHLLAFIFDNLGRTLGTLDLRESELGVKTPTDKYGLEGFKIYVSKLMIAVDTLIYRALINATKEYHNLPEDNQSIPKTPRTFMYILWSIISSSSSVLGGITRENVFKNKITSGLATSRPFTYPLLMSKGGQEYVEGSDITLVPKTKKDMEEDSAKLEKVFSEDILVEEESE